MLQRLAIHLKSSNNSKDVRVKTWTATYNIIYHYAAAERLLDRILALQASHKAAVQQNYVTQPATFYH